MDTLINNPFALPVIVVVLVALALGIIMTLTSRRLDSEEDAHERSADILGEKPPAEPGHIAIVHCQGASHHMQNRYLYEGTMTCAAANIVQKGPGSCSWGCIGYGDCVEACEYDAIHIYDDLARVKPDRCTACGKCIPACPKHLIRFEPDREDLYTVRCSNPLTGELTHRNCDIGCTGCKKCVYACKYDAIHLNGMLALIDQSKCTQCGECLKVCNTNSIVLGRALPDTTPQASRSF